VDKGGEAFEEDGEEDWGWGVGVSVNVGMRGKRGGGSVGAGGIGVGGRGGVGIWGRRCDFEDAIWLTHAFLEDC